MKLRLVCDMFLCSYLKEIKSPDLDTWGIPSPGMDGFKSDLAHQLGLCCTGKNLPEDLGS